MALNGRTTGFVYFFSLIFFANILTSLQLCTDDTAPRPDVCEECRLYIIRTTHPSGLVLDGTDQAQLRVQPFTGFGTQLWRLERRGQGLVSFRNYYHGTYLDYRTDWYGILTPKSGALTQLWSFGMNDGAGKITSGAALLNLDISGRNFVPGNPVGVWNDGDYPNQKWVVLERV